MCQHSLVSQFYLTGPTESDQALIAYSKQICLHKVIEKDEGALTMLHRETQHCSAIYSGAFTLCAWLLVFSHMIQDIWVDTHTHRGLAVWRRWGNVVYWVERDVLLPVTGLSFVLSCPPSQSKPHANQLSALLIWSLMDFFFTPTHWTDNHFGTDQLSWCRLCSKCYKHFMI